MATINLFGGSGHAKVISDLIYMQGDTVGIVYDDNPVDKWCLANTQIKTDINGNIQPVKGMDSRNRIDGTLALIDAYVVLQDKKDEYLSVL